MRTQNALEFSNTQFQNLHLPTKAIFTRYRPDMQMSLLLSTLAA